MKWCSDDLTCADVECRFPWHLELFWLRLDLDLTVRETLLPALRSQAIAGLRCSRTQSPSHLKIQNMAKFIFLVLFKKCSHFSWWTNSWNFLYPQEYSIDQGFPSLNYNINLQNVHDTYEFLKTNFLFLSISFSKNTWGRG